MSPLLKPTMTPEQEAEWEREMAARERVPSMPEQLRDLMQPGVEYTVVELNDAFAPGYAGATIRAWVGELTRTDRLTRITLQADDVRRHVQHRSVDHAYVRDAS